MILYPTEAIEATSEEALELEAIGELDEIFSCINAVIAASKNGATTGGLPLRMAFVRKA